MGKKFISWRRVSTKKQGNSGLGLEAQKEIIRYFIEREKGEWVADYEECYTGTELSCCVELHKAMAHCKKDGAVLIIAKSDRFRNTAEALKIYEEMGDGNIMFCDLPVSDKFSLTLFFALAEREALLVSIRTKQALAALKARGNVKLGAASEIYKANRAAKGEEALRAEARKRGAVRSKNFMERADVVAFMKVVRRVYPQYCNDEDYRLWGWSHVNSKERNATPMLQMMKDFHEMNGSLFQSWDFSDMQTVAARQRLNRFICTIKRSMSSARCNSVSV